MRDEEEQQSVTAETWRPDPTPSMLVADAVEVRAIVRAAREHLGMDMAFIGEFREGVRINRFIECGDSPALMADKSETLLEETYCRRIVAGEMPELMPDVSAVPAAQALAVTQESGSVPTSAFRSTRLTARCTEPSPASGASLSPAYRNRTHA